MIAIENVRLFKELEARNKDLIQSLEQQTATAEILRVISGSPTDVAPVFRVILEKANRLSNSAMSVLWMHEGDGIFRAVESVGINPEFVNWISGRRVTFAAPAFNPRGPWRPLQLHDVREIEPYKKGDPVWVQTADVAGIRTLLMVPLVREARCGTWPRGSR